MTEKKTKKKKDLKDQLCKTILFTPAVHSQLSHLKIDLDCSSISAVVEKLIRDTGFWNPKHEIDSNANPEEEKNLNGYEIDPV